MHRCGWRYSSDFVETCQVLLSARDISREHDCGWYALRDDLVPAFLFAGRRSAQLDAPGFQTSGYATVVGIEQCITTRCSQCVLLTPFHESLQDQV